MLGKSKGMKLGVLLGIPVGVLLGIPVGVLLGTLTYIDHIVILHTTCIIIYGIDLPVQIVI